MLNFTHYVSGINEQLPFVIEYANEPIENINAALDPIDAIAIKEEVLAGNLLWLTLRIQVTVDNVLLAEQLMTSVCCEHLDILARDGTIESLTREATLTGRARLKELLKSLVEVL